MRLVLALFALSAAVVAAGWVWLGRPIPVPQSALGVSGKLYCLSYAPFRDSQTPLDPTLRISAAQIEDDLIRLARITDCVRTYSVDYGLDQVADIAARHGLKVMQGLWVSSNPQKTAEQIEIAVGIANRLPNVVRSVIVGNEVLLRGEMLGGDLAVLMRAVKARVHVPVTYADVWEFWLRNADVAAAADFITIHILPYWEDFPIAAPYAAAHVDSIRNRVVAAFPGKDVLIGEFGWPSAGRMREGALPSPFNQARVIQDVLARARTENFRVNVIEAFDQPWKRTFEGTVGGHWGLLDGATREFKFDWGQPVSNHPYWLWQGIGGMLFVLVVFGVAVLWRRGARTLWTWLAVAACATSGGILLGITFENVPMQSLGAGGWVRSLATAGVAVLAPILGAAMIMSGRPAPRFSEIIGPISGRTADRLTSVYGLTLMAFTAVAIMVALGLVFDPRYRDFPFPPFTVAALPFLLHSLINASGSGSRSAAELTAAAILAFSIPYIALNESFGNWQSLWLCATFAALAVTLARVRGALS
ncbi:MAG: beta-(1-6) glucans synthase [Pseudolabrys sp.]|nr:beta-(1-6) glucans synthase [Pseudolabrys sp.]